MTGGCGYKGAVLVPKLLARGDRVRVIDTMWFGNFLAPHENLAVVQGDVRDIDQISFDDIEPEDRSVATQPGLFPGRGQPAPLPPVGERPNQPTLQCPDCYSSLVVAEGCLLCTACGYSKC